MTPDFLMSQLRLFAVALIAYLGGRGIFTPADSTFALAALTSLGPIIVPYAMSIYANINKVKVPANSQAAAVAATEAAK